MTKHLTSRSSIIILLSSSRFCQSINSVWFNLSKLISDQNKDLKGLMSCEFFFITKKNSFQCWKLTWHWKSTEEEKNSHWKVDKGNNSTHQWKIWCLSRVSFVFTQLKCWSGRLAMVTWTQLVPGNPSIFLPFWEDLLQGNLHGAFLFPFNTETWICFIYSCFCSLKLIK